MSAITSIAPLRESFVACAGGLASQETNWSGIVAEVTEFRRKGNTLTAKVRLRNQGSGEVQPEVIYKEVYLMDLAAGKKYQVLQDEKGAYIAGLRSGWNDRWYATPSMNECCAPTWRNAGFPGRIPSTA